MTSRLPAVLALAVALLGLGCATTPRVESMVPSTEGAAFASSDKSLAVVGVQGGQESSAWEGSKINARDFRLALVDALQQSQLFTRVSSGPPSDLELTGTLLTQDQPGMGIGMTVRMSVRYVLTDTATGEELFNDIVASTYTAGMGEAFVGVVRVRKANEGAVRENISRLIERLAPVLLE